MSEHLAASLGHTQEEGMFIRRGKIMADQENTMVICLKHKTQNYFSTFLLITVNSKKCID